MAYEAKIIKDSIAAETGYRLTTIQVTLPRFVLAEFNTHRVFSRNSASSQAIPVEKQIKKILEDPAVPIYWGKNQPGMKARTELSDEDKEKAKRNWEKASIYAALGVLAMNGGLDSVKDNELKSKLEQLKAQYPVDYEDLSEPLHKQASNRLIEPSMWQTIITTATEWDNFFALRTHPDAQPEIQQAARLMQGVYNESEPNSLKEGEWHLPLIQPEEEAWAKENVETAIKVSVGRCARVSYLTHDGIRDIEKDIQLHDSLMESGHMSPAEHAATPMAASYTRAHKEPFSGNFRVGYSTEKQLLMNTIMLRPKKPEKS